MFTFEQFDKLHSIWDGKAKNFDVCCSCGRCCDNWVKSLFPNEYEYLKERTGQINSKWVSHGCLCNEIGLNIKSIICKIYPLFFEVTRKDWKLLMHEDGKPHYDYGTSHCLTLDYDIDKVNEFASYLFSDEDNRLFYSLRYREHYEEVVIKENKGIKMDKEDIIIQSFYKILNVEQIIKGFSV